MCLVRRAGGAYIKAPKTAPPLNVELMAPMMAVSLLVLKNDRKLGDCITSVITPESYPNKKDPVAAKTARAMLKTTPMFADVYS